MEVKRFKSTIKWLSAFQNNISVVCPNCEKKAALIRVDKDYYVNLYEFKCDNCFVEIKEVEKLIYSVKRNCPFCPCVIQYESSPTLKIKDRVNVTCKGCKNSLEYKPQKIRVNEWLYKGKNIQFHYWYSKEFKGEEFWAINIDHLIYLENFISAKLRERNIDSMGMMLVDKLPRFLKDKRNRDELLKLISKLKDKK